MDRARNRMVKSLRLQTVTRPPESYASLMAGRIELHAPAEEQLKRAMEQCCDKNLPVRQWESVIFRRRVKNYSETMLDRLLAQGDYFWKMAPDGNLSFHRYDDIDWGAGSAGGGRGTGRGRTAFVPGVKKARRQLS